MVILIKIIFYIPFIIWGLNAGLDSKSVLFSKMYILLSFISRFHIVYNFFLKDDIEPKQKVILALLMGYAI